MESCVQLRRFGGDGVIMVCCSVIVYLLIGVESSYGVMCSSEEVWRRWGGSLEEMGVIMVCCSVIVYLLIGVESSYGVMYSADEVWRGWGDNGVLFNYSLSVYRRGMFLWSHVFS